MKNNWTGIAFISALSLQCQQELDACVWQVAYRKGEAVIWEDDDCKALYFVSSGVVDIYRTAVDGREHTLGVIMPGQVLNVVPVLREEAKNPANARCIRDTILLVLGREDARRLMGYFPELAIALAAELADRLQQMTRKAGALALHTVRQRLAAFLIDEADQDDKDPHIFWTRDDMARQIGTVRDVIGRNLRDMETEGALRREKGNIILLDRVRLQRIANGEDPT